MKLVYFPNVGLTDSERPLTTEEQVHALRMWAEALTVHVDSRFRAVLDLIDIGGAVPPDSLRNILGALDELRAMHDSNYELLGEFAKTYDTDLAANEARMAKLEARIKKLEGGKSK